MSARKQQLKLCFEKVPTPLNRRWETLRRQVLPLVTFTCLALFTLFFWGAYVSPYAAYATPVYHSQDTQMVADKPVNEQDVNGYAVNVQARNKQPVNEHTVQTTTNDSVVRAMLGVIAE